MNIEPFNDNVIVKSIPKDNVTPGGIHLPENSKEFQGLGEVVAVGPGYPKSPLPHRVGDIVYYNEYGGQKLNYKGVEYIVLSERDILCRVFFNE